MADPRKGFGVMQDRMGEPLFTPKENIIGKESTVLLFTEQLVPENYANNGLELNNRFGEDATVTIPLKNLDRVPDFKLAKQLPKDAEFSFFLPRHQEMAKEVINVLMSVPENQLQDLLSTCVFSRVNLNPQLFNYCYSVAMMHRRDTREIPLKNVVEVFPSKFMESQVFQQARETAAVIPPDVPRIPIIIPRDFTATDLEEEHRVAYWREDIGVNLHHYHWHLVYPFTNNDISIVNKDRRGELFYYMHQQVIARYNCERLCNNLKRVKKFSNWREPIPEAYFPKLDSLTTARGWPPRQSGMTWKDLNREAEGAFVTVDQMERWRKNVEEAISTGRVRLPNGSTQPLTIDILGNLLEASDLSPNPQLYGSIHNNGHNLTAYMHDPDHRYLENFAVIADEATTMRDPFFYRWHAWIDDTCQKHKESSFVPPYTRAELENPGVQVTSVSIETAGGQPNTLQTYWMQNDVDMSRGLDFADNGPVLARFTHLNHRPFQYRINVNNSGSSRRTTVRIFLTPQFDERNQPFIFSDQRKLCIEMDKFVTVLNAGRNEIVRQSSQSSVTIPFEQTFRDLSPQGDNARRPELSAFNYCGCGWPQHMLVPKGTEGGVTYKLFVMLSNYEFDRVDQEESQQKSCTEASSYCGLKDKKYPDRRAMGFPFDRPSSSAANLQDFILPNMGLQDVTIRLQNVTEPNPRNPPTA